MTTDHTLRRCPLAGRGARRAEGRPSASPRFTGGRRVGIGAALLAPLLLAACNTPIATQVTRDAARSAINPVVARQFPGVPLEPATNCIIDNASADEIVGVATASATGANDTVTRIVLDVAARPDTIQCLATDGLPVLLNTL